MNSVSRNEVIPPPPTASSASSSSSTEKIVEAIAATAAISFIITGIFFILYRRHGRQRQKNAKRKSFHRQATAELGRTRAVHRTVRGVVVDENGRDVLYMKNADGERVKQAFTKVLSNRCYETEEEEKEVKIVDVTVENRSRKNRNQEFLVHEKSCQPVFFSQEKEIVKEQIVPKLSPDATKLPVQCPPLSPAESPSPPLVPPPPTPPPTLSPLPPAPPLPPRLPRSPALPSLAKRSSTATPPPPPPPRPGGPVSPPPAPRTKAYENHRALNCPQEIITGADDGHKKLKPLHWDKVIANADHSMVWDHITNGSLGFDDKLIEALFGYTTSSRRSPQGSGITSSSSSSHPTPTAQTFILEPLKSQNKAIVLKSLTVSRKEIIEAISEGHGLTMDVLEKLTRISPTQEEETKILQFNGNPTKLADAESFLYYILKAVPSAFTRINAMHFRSSYDSEILQLKESMQTLELGCKELRTRGLFLKLLEAILKAGNKMNAGTTRGNALGFNLSALRKLSDIKSNDGKTTLLHFVVEQVAQSEGRRGVLAQIRPSDDHLTSSGATSAEDRTDDHLALGLLALGGLSSEFSNIRRAATIEHISLINSCASLAARAGDIRLILTRRASGQADGFLREMEGFLEHCEAELEALREEQRRVMDLVRRTTEYYQTGSPKQRETDPLQLFAIVKDFLDMVDRVCVDISRKLQVKNPVTTRTVSSSPTTTTTMTDKNVSTFQVTRLHLTSDVSQSSSFSASGDDFSR